MLIWKFPLAIAVIQTVSMPARARLLSIQRQDPGERPLSLWAIVEKDVEHVQRRIIMVGTGLGVELTAPVAYIGTVQVGPFVGHFFDAGQYDDEGEPWLDPEIEALIPKPPRPGARSFIGGKVE